MKLGALLKRDWVLALLLSLLFVLAAWRQMPVLEGLERSAYDFGVRRAHPAPGAADQIAIVAIDDESIKQIGRWPWPRTVLAEMVAQLASAQAKAIALQILLLEPQADPGLYFIQKIGAILGNSARFRSALPNESAQVLGLLQQADQELNADRRLATVLPQAGNVLLPSLFSIGVPLGKPDAPLPEYVTRNQLKQVVKAPDSPAAPLETYRSLAPLPEFGEPSAGIGHLTVEPDRDGTVRGEPLVLEYYGAYYPSMALLAAARHLNLGPNDITVDLGGSVKLGNLTIRTDRQFQMLSHFYTRSGESLGFPVYAFHDVLAGKVPEQVFAGKTVLIGATAAGVGSLYITPTSDRMPAPVLTANIITSILNQDFFTRPAWTLWVELVLYLLVIGYLMAALPRIPAGIAAGVSSVLLLLLLGANHYLLLSDKVWLRSVSPALLLLIGHLAITTKRFFATEQQKIKVESDSAQTNRMLGLAFQSQGQLDMAFDKFRSLPVDDSVLELMYNLALDFERKRQFNKAVSAYDYVLQHNPKFRDTADRKKRANQVDSTMIIGGARPAPGGTMVLDNVDQKPTLGRYQVERELGKGAMGAVYLGRDPKINRVVAIKTMALSQEFEGAALEDAKQRFFREAETAGRLNHPNIVTIYDAGEDQDLAYIAMEFLEGRDLTDHIKPDTLLPIPEVVEIVVRIGEALQYAHSHEVVHRDIKPANIMYNPAKHAIKVTDFGIARITASSRTKTGMVLGTPSYMSPEQLAGKHVDGRSDLFSLGVMTFEMLTGFLPFQGDSLATLMFQIANEPHPDICMLRPDLPPCMREFIDRALSKDATKRYQNGEEYARAIRQCAGAAKERAP